MVDVYPGCILTKKIFCTGTETKIIKKPMTEIKNPIETTKAQRNIRKR
jgi:hypothetical protein